MASENRLLGQARAESKVAIEVTLFNNCWLYHADTPKGILVKRKKLYDELIELGWVDHPGKCIRLKGHEDLFEENTEVEVEPEVEVEVEPEPIVPEPEPAKVSTAKAKVKAKAKPESEVAKLFSDK